MESKSTSLTLQIVLLGLTLILTMLLTGCGSTGAGGKNPESTVRDTLAGLAIEEGVEFPRFRRHC